MSDPWAGGAVGACGKVCDAWRGERPTTRGALVVATQAGVGCGGGGSGGGGRGQRGQGPPRRICDVPCPYGRFLGGWAELWCRGCFVRRVEGPNFGAWCHGARIKVAFGKDSCRYMTRTKKGRGLGPVLKDR